MDSSHLKAFAFQKFFIQKNLIILLWQSSLRHRQLIHILRQRHQCQHRLGIRKAAKHIGTVCRIYCPDTLHLSKCLHILIVSPDC